MLKAENKKILKALNELDSNFQKVIYDSDRRIFKAGIKEVIDFMLPLFHFYECNRAHDCPIYPKIKAKLKEWGINQEDKEPGK